MIQLSLRAEEWCRSSRSAAKLGSSLASPGQNGTRTSLLLLEADLCMVMQKWCTHNLLWVQSVRTELGLSACNQSAFWRQRVKAPAFFITHPPTLCCIWPLSGLYFRVRSENGGKLKMSRHMNWNSWERFSISNHPRKKCFHHFGLGCFSFSCCRVLATHCFKYLK